MSDLTAFIGPNIWADMEHNLTVPTTHFLSLVNDDGEVVAIAGWTFVRAGTIEVGVYRSDSVDNYWLGFSRIIKNLVDLYIPNRIPNVHRAEIYVDVDWEMGGKWANFLGFEYEGICRAYDKNYKDHALYSKIYERAK